MSSVVSEGGKTFLDTAAAHRTRNGSAIGHIVWCGDSVDESTLNSQLKGTIAETGAIICTKETLARTLSRTRHIVAVVIDRQGVVETIRLLGGVRKQAYQRGIGPPIYAALVETEDEKDKLWAVCDIVSTTVNDPKDKFSLRDLLHSKLSPDPSSLQNEVVWIDPAHQSSTMRTMAGSLERIGMKVILCGTEDEVVRSVSGDTFAVVVTSRTGGLIATLRQRFAEDSCRPLFWLVSLSCTVDTAYGYGADAAIVKENPLLAQHERHIRQTTPDPWMWAVVVGDIKSYALCKGVNGIGGMMWSMPKLIDDRSWVQKNYNNLRKSGDEYFQQVATQHNILVAATISPTLEDENLQQRMQAFMAARSRLKGYVFEKMLYHGTSVEVAQKIMADGFKASERGMYGPGVYLVDANGISKALFFAMSRSPQGFVSDDEGRSKRVQSKRGAVIAVRVGFCSPCPVTELKNWYGRTSPCQGVDDSVIGTAGCGYSDTPGFWKTEVHGCLNDIPEYVVINADLAMPIGFATFTADW